MSDINIAAIAVEYYKDEILNISKPYLQNLTAYDYSRAAFTSKRSHLWLICCIQSQQLL